VEYEGDVSSQILRYVVWQKLADISEMLSVLIMEAESTSETLVSFCQMYVERCPRRQSFLGL
jgi:hypothetical protein